MITIKIGKKNGVFRAVSDGHADYDPGKDVVCSAVSAVMFTLMGAVENLTHGGKKKIHKEAGHVDVRYVPTDRENDAVCAVIFNTAIIGVLQLEMTYPEHIKFEQ